MLTEIPVSDSDQALANVANLMKDFLALSPKLSHRGDSPNLGVDSFVRQFALSKKNLTLGKIITVFMQFPSGITPSIFHRLADEKPYNSMRLGFEFRLRNVSNSPIDIEYYLHTQPIRKVKQTGIYAETERWISKPVYGSLEPNDTVDLNFHYSALNLCRYSREAREPIFWENSGVKTVLEEVGYSFDYQGQRIKSWDLESWPRDEDGKVKMKVSKGNKSR